MGGRWLMGRCESLFGFVWVHDLTVDWIWMYKIRQGKIHSELSVWMIVRIRLRRLENIAR